MKGRDLQRAGIIVMLLTLAVSAPQWLNPANQKQSSYDAPWIYPSLRPDH